MPWIHHRIVAKRKQHAFDGRNQRLVVPARKMGAADRAGEQRVAHEQIPTRLAPLADLKADAAGAVTWRVVRPRLVRAEGDYLTGHIKDVDRRLRFGGEAEQRP